MNRNEVRIEDKGNGDVSPESAELNFFYTIFGDGISTNRLMSAVERNRLILLVFGKGVMRM